MSDNNSLKDVLRVLNAYVSEFGGENVTIEFPQALEKSVSPVMERAKATEVSILKKVNVCYIESNDSINVRSSAGANYIKKIEFKEGLTGENK